jgi:hypothetical protein
MHSVGVVWDGWFPECLKKWLPGAHFGSKTQ